MGENEGWRTRGGFALPKGFEIRLIEDTGDTIHIPMHPFLKEDTEAIKNKSRISEKYHILG